MIAIIYLRVSTDDQAEHGYSLSAQRKECTKKAEELGAKPIEFVDEGVSGTILYRPGLSAAMERIETGGVDYFICQDHSRLSRSVGHSQLLRDHIRHAGAKLIYVNGMSGDSPEHELHTNVMSSIDQYERKRIVRRTRDGKRAKAQLGKLTHPPNSYGYKFDPATDTLVIREVEALHIQQMFKWVTTEAQSCYSIANTLNHLGIPSPKGKEWSRQTVRRILSNESYTGKMVLQQYDTRDVKLNKYKPPPERVRRKKRPESEWVYVEVPKIIDRDVWADAQLVLQEGSNRWRSYGTRQYMLSRIVQCLECGSTLHGNQSKHPYYVCTAKSPGIKGMPTCRLKHVRADKLEPIIWKTIVSGITNSEQLDEAILKVISKKKPYPLSSDLDMLIKQQAELTEQRQRLVTLYQKGRISETEVETRISTLDEQAKAVESMKADIEVRLGTSSQDSLRGLSETRQRILQRLGSLSEAGRARVARMCIQGVLVSNKSVEVRALMPLGFKPALAF